MTHCTAPHVKSCLGVSAQMLEVAHASRALEREHKCRQRVACLDVSLLASMQRHLLDLQCIDVTAMQRSDSKMCYNASNTRT